MRKLFIAAFALFVLPPSAHAELSLTLNREQVTALSATVTAIQMGVQHTALGATTHGQLRRVHEMARILDSYRSLLATEPELHELASVISPWATANIEHGAPAATALLEVLRLPYDTILGTPSVLAALHRHASSVTAASFLELVPSPPETITLREPRSRDVLVQIFAWSFPFAIRSLSARLGQDLASLREAVGFLEVTTRFLETHLPAREFRSIPLHEFRALSPSLQTALALLANENVGATVRTLVDRPDEAILRRVIPTLQAALDVIEPPCASDVDETRGN